MINIPKGTKDVLPYESYKWQFVEKTAREVCSLFNFREIRTPVFEHTELFLRSIGDTTDIVNKEMYTFDDKGGRSMTLKPEGTAGVARSYIENNLEACSLPLKMFYLTPVFRYERPQAGRLREHHQFGIEAYGSPSPYMDGEVISLAYMFLTRLGIRELTLHVNSIGCPKCRADYNAALKGYLASRVNELCENCRERLTKNPLRILDCKVESCKQIVDGAPKITDYLCDECKAHKVALEGYLTRAGVPFVSDPDVVRGLDYYTRTVFEFVTTALGAQGTVCGGGRYDNLVASVGGRPTPCVGFGLGLERLLMLMDALGVKLTEPKPDVFIVMQSAEYRDICLSTTAALRSVGIKADTEFNDRSVKAQFKYADKIGARFVFVIGGAEADSGVVRVKRMADGVETEVRLDGLEQFFDKELK